MWPQSLRTSGHDVLYTSGISYHKHKNMLPDISVTSAVIPTFFFPGLSVFLSLDLQFCAAAYKIILKERSNSSHFCLWVRSPEKKVAKNTPRYMTEQKQGVSVSVVQAFHSLTDSSDSRWRHTPVGPAHLLSISLPAWPQGLFTVKCEKVCLFFFPGWISKWRRVFIIFTLTTNFYKRPVALMPLFSVTTQSFTAISSHPWFQQHPLPSRSTFNPCTLINPHACFCSLSNCWIRS